MSECRCGEIKNCQGKLSCVNNALSQLSACQDSFSNIAANLSSLSTYSQQAYSSDKIWQITVALKGLDNDLISAKEAFYKKLIAKKEELSNELSGLEGEDEAYHEEERRKISAAANGTPSQ